MWIKRDEEGECKKLEGASRTRERGLKRYFLAFVTISILFDYLDAFRHKFYPLLFPLSLFSSDAGGGDGGGGGLTSTLSLSPFFVIHFFLALSLSSIVYPISSSPSPTCHNFNISEETTQRYGKCGAYMHTQSSSPFRLSPLLLIRTLSASCLIPFISKFAKLSKFGFGTDAAKGLSVFPSTFMTILYSLRGCFFFHLLLSSFFPMKKGIHLSLQTPPVPPKQEQPPQRSPFPFPPPPPRSTVALPSQPTAQISITSPLHPSGLTMTHTHTPPPPPPPSSPPPSSKGGNTSRARR